MKLRVVHLLILSIALLAGVLVLQLWKTLRGSHSLVPIVTELAPGITQRARDFHRSQVKNGRTVWEVSASEVEYSQSRSEASVRNVTVKWYLREGQAVSIHSDFGRLRLQGADLEAVEADGNVEFSVAEYVLRIPSASYERNSQRILSPGPVTLTGGGLELSGSKLEVDLRTNSLLLHGEVRMVLEPNAAGKELPHAPS